MGLNNVNGNNKALDLIKSIGIPEEQPQVQEQTEIEEQPQVQEQAQIAESELQEVEIAEEEEIDNQVLGETIANDSLLVNSSSISKNIVIGPTIKKPNPMMQMMQKLMQMMMQLLQMMMGKIHDEPPEKPQPIERVDLPVKSLYSIPELD